MNPRQYRLILATVALAMGAASQSSAQLTLANTAPVLGNPISLTVGDYNNDTYPDVAVADLNGNNVTVLLNTKAGTLTPEPPIGVAAAPRAIATGDFDNDGWPDLAVVGSGGLTVLINNEAATPFASFHTLAQPNASGFGLSSPEGIAVGDFNEDGCPDLAITNFGDSTVSILLNSVVTKTPKLKCSGIFTATTPVGNATSIPNPSGIAVGYFYNAKHLDLAVVNALSGTVTIFKGNGNGKFDGGVTYSLYPGLRVLDEPQSIAVGDFNGDGLPDIVVSVDSDVATPTQNGGAAVLLNDKASRGTFLTPAVVYPADLLPSSVAVGDFNGDGILDLVLSNAYSADISVLYGNGSGGKGDGTFQPPVNYPVGFLPTSVITGNFNKEPGPPPDVAVANFGGNSVTVYIGH